MQCDAIRRNAQSAAKKRKEKGRKRNAKSKGVPGKKESYTHRRTRDADRAVGRVPNVHVHPPYTVSYTSTKYMCIMAYATALNAASYLKLTSVGESIKIAGSV